ncbi:MAG: helix-turn-helix domain-containing protein [Oscillospiraceae bacterium]|nr:helix-turn-helix domain-containing protein [Oscillospiraceae bacterium]
MELSDLKLTVASNLINLRTGRGMTQAELGAKLNYSDKTISKWERGEAIPDAYVLLQLAELFGVTVDELLSAHDRWKPPPEPEEEDRRRSYSYSINMIIAVVMVGVFTLALTVFVTLWLIGLVEWRVFLVGLSAALLVYLILDCVFKKARHLPFVIGAFVASLFLLLFFFLPLERPWQLFLLLVPAEAIVFLSCNIRRIPRMKGLEKLIKKE